MRLIEIPDDGIIKEFIWRGDSVVGKRCIDLSYMPTIKAEPVRHGRWVMTLYTTTSKRGRVISNKKLACSECGYSNGRKQNNYCPDCGAKMDGDNHGNVEM